jgi:hypothetical protein
MKYIITETQYNLLTESLPLEIRRRFPHKNLMNDMEYGILDEIVAPCDYEDIGYFIEDACDSLVEMYDNYFEIELDYTLTPKDRDSLYYYFVDFFRGFLIKYYKNKCV